MTNEQPDVPAAIALLQGLADRAGWAHSLAYERPGRRYDRERRGRDSDAPPVGTWDQTDSVSAVADREAGSRWHVACLSLTSAWNNARAHLPAKGVLMDLDEPSPLSRRHPAPRHMQHACTQLASLLRRVPHPDLLEPSEKVALIAVTTAIARADTAIPDQREPWTPCKNPRRRHQCTRRIDNQKHGLCQSCLAHERRRAENRARTRKRNPEGCMKFACDKSHHANGLCNSHYKAAAEAKSKADEGATA